MEPQVPAADGFPAAQVPGAAAAAEEASAMPSPAEAPAADPPAAPGAVPPAPTAPEQPPQQADPVAVASAPAMPQDAAQLPDPPAAAEQPQEPAAVAPATVGAPQGAPAADAATAAGQPTTAQHMPAAALPTAAHHVPPAVALPAPAAEQPPAQPAAAAPEQPLQPPQQQAPLPPAGEPPAPAGEAQAAPADFELPTMPEEKHPQKPTWRRGYLAASYSRTQYLMVTLTPSDCSTRRLRPPREWYEGLLGGFFQNFVVATQAPNGSAVSFLLKAHAYEYVKAEYYVAGGETKRLFRELGLKPGDALKISLAGKSSGIPTTRVTIIPAARNPHAAAILASAAEQAAKREARLAANPKGPKGVGGGGGGGRKRKKGAGEEEDSDEGFEGLPGEGCAGGRRSRQRARKQFGEDFVSGLDEAWAAAQHSDDDFQPNSDYEAHSGGGDRRRRGRGGASRSAAASSGPAWLAAAGGSAQQQQQQQQQGSGSGLAGMGIPEVVATGVAEGRNVLRIKINRQTAGVPPPGTAAGAAAAAAAAGGQGQGQGQPVEGASAGGGSRGQGSSDPGCPLKFLAGLADGVGTPMGQQQGPGGVATAQQAQQQPGDAATAAGVATAAAAGAGAGTKAEGGGAAAPEPVVLLSKKLLRDEAGGVTGVTCKLGWEKGSRSAMHVSRALSQFGVAHADSAAVETFEVKPEDCLLELTLRLQQAAAGKVEVLETAIVQLLDAL